MMAASERVGARSNSKPLPVPRNMPMVDNSSAVLSKLEADAVMHSAAVISMAETKMVRIRFIALSPL